MLSAPQIRQKVEFSCNPRVRLDEKSSFHAFCAADWAKSPVFPQSARRIWQNTDVLRFLHGRFDEKSVFRRAEKDAPRRRQPACGAGKAYANAEIDSDVLEWFRSKGSGYQTKINAALRRYAFC